MSITLRLHGERDGSVCDVSGYTLTELRASGCEYLRSFLDFGAATVAFQPEGEGEDATASDVSDVLEVHTGSCGAALAASALHFLTRGSAEAPLEVDGDNAAELLSLADLWCADKVKAHVLGSLRRSMCNGFRRPVSGTAAVEAVPQVAALVKKALDFGISDADGGLKGLYDDCTIWLAQWAARAWPTRTFASLQRAIQDEVLEAAKGLIDLDTAPAVLSTCRQLSGVPAVSWARRIHEMRNELTSYTMSYIWSNFLEVCVRAGLRRCRSECWGALLEELRNHVAENPDPDAAVRVLPRWACITKALMYGAAPATIAAAFTQEAGAGGGGSAGGGGGGGGFEAPREDSPLAAAVAAALQSESSWLGGDEVSHMQDLYELVRSYCVRHLSHVARCAAFRALSPMEQQSILLIAQEGICTGLATGAIDDATSRRQPGAAAVANNTGTRSSAAWVISLASAPAAATPPATSRPRRQQAVRAGGGDSRQPPQLPSVASAPPAVSLAPGPSEAASSLSPSAAAAPQLRTAERAARRSMSLRQATGSSSSNATAAAAAAAVVQPLKTTNQSGAAVGAGAIGSRPAPVAVVASPLRPGTSEGGLSVEARPRSRRSNSLMSGKESTGSDGGLGSSLTTSIDAAPLAGLLVPDAGTESPAAVALVAVAVAGSETEDSSIHVQRDAEEESLEVQTAAVQTSKAATLAAMEGGVDEEAEHATGSKPERGSGGNDNRGGSCVGDDSIPGASPARADTVLATVGDCGFGAASRTEALAAIQLQGVGLQAEAEDISKQEEVSTVPDAKDDWQPAAVAAALIGTGVEIGRGGPGVKAEESEAARLHVEPELEVVYGAEARLPTGGFHGSPSARIGEDGVEADTSAKDSDGAPEASALSGTTTPAKDGAVASLGDAAKGRGSFHSWIGAGPDDPGSTLPLVPLPLVPLPAGAGALKPFSNFDDLLGDGGVASQPPTPAQREAVGLLGSRPTEVQDDSNGVGRSDGGGGTGGADCSSDNVAGSVAQVETSTPATDYPRTCSTEDSAVSVGIQDLSEIGSDSAVTAAAADTFAAAAAAAAAAAGNASVADDTRQPPAGASGAAVRVSAAADTDAASATAVVPIASAASGISARGCSSTATVGCAGIRADSRAKQAAAGKVSERSRANRVPVAMVGLAPANDHSSDGGNLARSGAGTKPAGQRWVYGTAARSTTTATTATTATFSTANEVKACGTPRRRSTLTTNGAVIAASTATTATTTARGASRTAAGVRSRQGAADPASAAVAAPSNRRTVPCTSGASATTADSCHLPNRTAAPPCRAVRRAPVGDGVRSGVAAGKPDGGTVGTAELRQAGEPNPGPRTVSARSSPPLATATRPRALSARNPAAEQATTRHNANHVTLPPQLPQLPQPRPVGSRGTQAAAATAAATVKKSIASATSVKSPTAQRRSMPPSASERSSRRGGGFTTSATTPNGDMAV